MAKKLPQPDQPADPVHEDVIQDANLESAVDPAHEESAVAPKAVDLPPARRQMTAAELNRHEVLTGERLHNVEIIP